MKDVPSVLFFVYCTFYQFYQCPSFVYCTLYQHPSWLLLLCPIPFFPYSHYPSPRNDKVFLDSFSWSNYTTVNSVPDFPSPCGLSSLSRFGDFLLDRTRTIFLTSQSSTPPLRPLPPRRLHSSLTSVPLPCPETSGNRPENVTYFSFPKLNPRLYPVLD